MEITGSLSCTVLQSKACLQDKRQRTGRESMLRALPPNEQELPEHPQAAHGDEDAPDGHSLAEAHHHSGLGQPLAQLAQQPVKALLAGVAVDLVRVSNAETLLGSQLFEGFHSAFPIIS